MRAFCFLAPCYISLMRSIIKPILLGLVLGTVLMAAIYAWALIGYAPAMSPLLKMALPHFNVAATFLEPVPPYDMVRGGERIDLLLLVAWGQISALAALLVAWVGMLSRRK